MKDHSLRGYLQRWTTEELDAVLACFLEGDNYIQYEHAILEILSILRERDAQEAAIKD